MNDDLWCRTCYPDRVHAAHKEGKTMSDLPTSKQNLWRMICLSVTHEEVGAYLEDGTDYEGPTEPIDARCHAWHPDLVDYQRVTETLLTRVEAANDPEVQKAVGWKLGYFDGKDWM